MERRLWTREEEIVVFNLYCKIPFNKSSKYHPEVIRIANLIGRTASAVLLIASHIKPWHACSADEKTNPHNGLCLNALHDMAFDKGFMTIDTDYKIHVSSEIKDIFQGKVVEKYFKCYEGNTIVLLEKFIPDKCFLEYHNDMIYEKWKRGK